MSDLIGDAVNMSNCSAAAMGGCIRVKQSLKLDEAVLAGCAASAGNAVASTGDVAQLQPVLQCVEGISSNIN